MIARRYLVILSLEPGRAASAAKHAAVASGLAISFASARICVLTEAAAHCVPFAGGEGAFVGTLFSAGADTDRVDTVPAAVSRSILATDGRAALNDYWGGYILVCEDRNTGTVSVSRDPSGAMPCYRVQTRDLHVCASDLGTLMAADFLTPTIAVPALLRHLAFPDVRLEETCIEGVSDLLPGMRIELGATGVTPSLWWSPWRFAGNPVSGSGADLARRLRDTVDRCVGAWSSCCDNTLLGLSGGLDSSILASALHQCHARFGALNMVDQDADGDERPYARLVAGAFGVALDEREYDAEIVDLRSPSAAHLPRPMGTAHMQSYEFAVRQLVQEHAFDAWFNGIGGDSVFCWLRSALPVADSVLSLRSPAAILRCIGDVAMLADVSASTVLRQTLRFLLQGRRSVRPRSVERLLTPEARNCSARLQLPPWFAAPTGILPGRANHVEMIARVQNMIEGLDRWTAPPTVIPLLSQPIVELCLSISSWNWIAGGRNRAVARDAYADRLPARVIDRRSKGGPDRMSIAVCLTNLPLLREMLLDGHLAKSGLLDRDLLERLLTEQSILKNARHIDILQLADAESWYAHWRSFGETRSVAPALRALQSR